MPNRKKWSKERRKAFEEKQAAKRNPVPPSPPVDEANCLTPRPQSPFMRLSNELFRFHEELQSRLHDLADVFRF